jgi:hypothetical protein
MLTALKDIYEATKKTKRSQRPSGKTAGQCTICGGKAISSENLAKKGLLSRAFCHWPEGRSIQTVAAATCGNIYRKGCPSNIFIIPCVSLKNFK